MPSPSISPSDIPSDRRNSILTLSEMAKQSITASERRGILVVAALALIITGSGFFLNRCKGDDIPPPPPEISIVSPADSLGTDSLKSGAKGSNARGDKKRGGFHRNDSINRKDKRSRRSSKPKEKRTYHKRSPLDEPI